MKKSICARAMGALAVLGFMSTLHLANAGAPSTCDRISSDVSKAVTKDPSKVLMIVEDALVINESCACEIVKAAITAAGANDAMVQQIVQTALAVTPKMSAIIAECATVAAPNSAETVAALAGGNGKSDGKKGSLEGTKGSDFSDAWASNIRGVYLIQPAAAGFVTVTDTKSAKAGPTGKQADKNNDDDANDNDDTVNRANSRRTRNLVALSPAQARP